jgi:hypothetical protein
LNRAIPTCVLVLAAAFSLYGPQSNAGQNVYRWTDDRGNPVNSDRPPPTGTKYEVISTHSSMVRPVDADEGAVPPTVKPSPGNEFEPVDSKKPKDEKNPEYCKRAQENLQTLNTSARIRIRNEQGEYRYIDEAEKKEQRKQAEAAIKTYCEKS